MLNSATPTVTDPISPAQLVASVDVYPEGNTCGDQLNTSCYDATYKPVAQVMPLIAGETGEAPNYLTPTTYVDMFMNWMDAKREWVHPVGLGSVGRSDPQLRQQQHPDHRLGNRLLRPHQQHHPVAAGAAHRRDRRCVAGNETLQRWLSDGQIGLGEPKDGQTTHKRPKTPRARVAMPSALVPARPPVDGGPSTAQGPSGAFRAGSCGSCYLNVIPSGNDGGDQSRKLGEAQS
jgi:hypothetical protein